MDIILDKTFNKEDFSGSTPEAKEYEACTFIDCDFSNSDLSHIIFVECVFQKCNMKMVRVANTTLRDVEFKGCNCLGVNFFECNNFMLLINFRETVLRLASFNNLKLKKISIINCDLKESDFSGANLTEATITGCEMESAVFMQTNLTKADLRNSFNYNIDPENNKLTRARFSLAEIHGLLRKHNINIEF